MPDVEQPAAPWSALVDDAAIFPPGDAPLPEATAAHAARAEAGGVPADLVGSFVLRDTDLPLVRGFAAPLAVVVTGGAGQLAGPVGLATRLGLRLAGLEVALRDPSDLAGNARRVVAAVDVLRAEGLDDAVPVHVELPAQAPDHGWLGAADEVAAHSESLGLRLKLRTGGVEPGQVPPAGMLAAWIEAALDRETPFKCTAGLHHALAAEGRHGFLNVLAATRACFDGAAAAEVADLLATTDPDRLLAPGVDELARGRRWFTSFGSCSVAEPLADLERLGLLGVAA